MIKVYADYRLYNTVTNHYIDRGDTVNELSYFDDGNRIVLSDVKIKAIHYQEVTLELPDNCKTILNIKDIEDWR